MAADNVERVNFRDRERIPTGADLAALLDALGVRRDISKAPRAVRERVARQERRQTK